MPPPVRAPSNVAADTDSRGRRIKWAIGILDAKLVGNILWDVNSLWARPLDMLALRSVILWLRLVPLRSRCVERSRGSPRRSFAASDMEIAAVTVVYHGENGNLRAKCNRKKGWYT